MNPVSSGNGAAKQELIYMPDPCITFRAASRAITHLYDLVLAPTGIKSTQFIILYAISQKTEIAQWDLSKRYSISVETLSRRLAFLRKSELVEMHLGPNHNERLYKLTEAGRKKLVAAVPYWNRAQGRFLQVAGLCDWNVTLKAAEKAVIAAHKAETAKLKNKAAAPVII